jgi:hypothetical protein
MGHLECLGGLRVASGPFYIVLMIIIAIARTAHSTAQSSGIFPIVIIIIVVDDLISILWGTGQDGSWFVLPAA